MCQACEEMQMFYAYLDAMEEAKRKAQPWECEVTVISQDSEAAPQPKPAEAKPSMGTKTGFACDEPE